jgi:AraC family transcriptional regulator
MNLRIDAAYVRRVEPRASGWRTSCWDTGVFDTGKHPGTDVVEGTIRAPGHLLLVNIQGGAEHLEVATECGHRYDGSDAPGAVSFVPGNCERKLRLVRVQSEWASVSFRPELFDGIGATDREDTRRRVEIPPFTNIEDRFLSSATSELWRLLNTDGSLDPLYCEALSLAVAHYLARRFGTTTISDDRARSVARLAPWQVRRINDLVEARIGGQIRIGELAAALGISPGHFHRAFSSATGQTPLAYINRARVRHAMSIQASENIPIAALALRVGFLSPSHFTRVFRQVTGCNPSALRRG